MSWFIADHHIAVQADDKIYHLKAEDVYEAQQSDSYCFEGIKLPPIEKSFPDLFFSPINKEAVIEVYSFKEQIKLKILVDGVKIDFYEGYPVDQIIINNEWFYISNIEEIVTYIGDIKENDCNISISRYIELIRTNDSLINKVELEKLKTDLLCSIPSQLEATLYKYQKDGFAWLDYMLTNNKGCILGDEMGLGKTIQSIALILKRKYLGKQSLVIAPVSLLDNWKNECQKFAPTLNVLIHHGAKRTGSPKGFDGYDLIVTSYGNAVTDNILFTMHNWDLIILDEAQNIKTPNSSRTKSVKRISAQERLAITGTPFENHIVDIWSLIDFIMPDYLGSASYFKNSISDDLYGARQLEPVLSSLMIRRLVKDVANDLPEKIIVTQPLSMSVTEIEAYEKIRLDLLQQNVTSLPVLQKLRMFCTHPAICCDEFSYDYFKASIKYQRLCELLEEIFSRDEKVLIFTTYQKMFDIFKQDIALRFKIPLNSINGSTPAEDRQKIVDWFNSIKGKSLLILNPTAAGTGLNITSANHVIHYNLDWNPSKEDQASARAYRRGQKKTTFIYRLYYKNTVEDIVNQCLNRKREISKTAVIGSDGSIVSVQDVIDALNLSPKGLDYDTEYK